MTTISDEKLKLPLLVMSDEGSAATASASGEPPQLQLRVNFDPALIKLLREVKYFLLLEIKVRLCRACCASKGSASVVAYVC